MQNKKARRPGRRSRGLRLESLETRFALAMAAFDVNLFHDDSGAVGAVVANDTLTVGDTFFVEITAIEYDPYFSGFQRVALDIQWDPNVLQEVDANWDPTDINNPIVSSNLPFFRQGTLDNATGSITDLSGSAAPAFKAGRAIGDGIAERFSLLRFKAIAPVAASPFEMWQGGSSIATVPVSSLNSKHLRFEAQTITVLPTAPPDIEPVAASTDGSLSNKSNEIESTNNEQIVWEIDKDVPPSGTAIAPEIVTTLPSNNAVATETTIEPDSITIKIPPLANNVAVPVFPSNALASTESDLAFGSVCHALIPKISPASSDPLLTALAKAQLFESSIRMGPFESVEVQATVDAVFARHSLDQVLSADDGVVLDSLIEDFLKARRNWRERNRPTA